MGDVTNQYSLSLTDPEAFGYPIALGFDIFDEAHHYSGGANYDEQTSGLQLRAGKVLSPYVTARTALRYSTVHATNAQVAKMLEAIETCETHADDLAAFREADVAFHRALAEIPGNPIFTALHDTFVEKLMKNRRI